MSDSAGRRFPVLLPGPYRGKYPTCPRWVPWELVAPFETRARLNHYQSLEKLAGRGGLSPLELLCVLDDKPFPSDHEAAQGGEKLRGYAVQEVTKRVGAWLRAQAGAVEAAVEQAWGWTCTFCAAANHSGGAVPPAVAACKFCRVPHRLRRGDLEPGVGGGQVAAGDPGRGGGEPGPGGPGGRVPAGERPVLGDRADASGVGEAGTQALPAVLPPGGPG